MRFNSKVPAGRELLEEFVVGIALEEASEVVVTVADSVATSLVELGFSVKGVLLESSVVVDSELGIKGSVFVDCSAEGVA